MSIDIWYEWHGICVRPCWKAGLDKGKTRGRCAAPALMGPGVGERKGAEMQILGRTGRFQNLELTCQCICAFVHLYMFGRQCQPEGWMELETSSAN